MSDALPLDGTPLSVPHPSPHRRLLDVNMSNALLLDGTSLSHPPSNHACMHSSPHFQPLGVNMSNALPLEGHIAVIPSVELSHLNHPCMQICIAHRTFSRSV